MTRAGYLLAIDQGSSATKCLLVDAAGRVVAKGSSPLATSCPKPGFVEQDGRDIWRSVQLAVAACLEGQPASDVVAVGIANQRESLLMWDRVSGTPLSPCLSWQDRRTADDIDALRTDATERLVRERSGLPLDPMFSAAKAKWILDNFDPDRRRARAGEIVLGTVDSFLLSRLSTEPVIEAGNASRTQLMNVRNVAWDADLCELFGVPLAALPRVVASTGPFPVTRGLAPLPDGVPLLAVMGDSHSALFAHGAFAPGTVKVTYGTGSSVMGIIDGPGDLDPGLCLTIGWMIDRPVFAAEGNIRATGAALRWTAELLGLTTDALAELAADADAQGVVLVPGFTGLGAPWWDRDAVGLITNLTPGAGRAAIARAALEAIPHQVADVVEAVDRTVGHVATLFADGGPTRNAVLMQLQADIAGRTVERSATAELSALGVAHLAGIVAGFWSFEDLASAGRGGDRFEPAMPEVGRQAARSNWREAVARARGTAIGPGAGVEATGDRRRDLRLIV